MCILFILLLLFVTTLSNAREIALSFDDAPRGSTFLSGPNRAALLIESLKASNVEKVVFFANSAKLNTEGINRLETYAKHGHLIGNHSHSHPELNKTTLPTYIQDIKTADAKLAHLPNFIKWFRYPYLREGDTQEKRDGVRKVLTKLAYFNAYVTVNNYDWYMDFLFKKAKESGRYVNMEVLRNTYVKVLVDSVEYYDEMAKAVLGRSPKHIILLHENDLAAFFIKDLVFALRKSGWKIIDPELAYEDEISQYKSKSILPANPGRIGEIAKDKDWEGRLWHEACNEDYLDKLFISNGVYSEI